MYLVAGLGNPGAQYERTRHNLGFRVIDVLADNLKTALSEHENQALWGEASLSGERIVLVKPLTFVNLSGQCIKALLKEFSIVPQELIVIHDDLDLHLGEIRLKGRGGSGGHKGVESIVASLGTENFARVRLGIGRPPGRQDPADYVLRPFTKRQQEQVDFILGEAAQAVISIIKYGLEKAMNVFNK